MSFTKGRKNFNAVIVSISSSIPLLYSSHLNPGYKSLREQLEKKINCSQFHEKYLIFLEVMWPLDIQLLQKVVYFQNPA